MDFPEWLLRELEKRKMTQADLARAANLTTGGVTHLINRSRRPSAETCQAISNAFHLPPETVFRAAGLLPPLPTEDAEWEIWKEKLRRLSPDERERFSRMLDSEIEYKERQEQIAAKQQRRKNDSSVDAGK